MITVCIATYNGEKYITEQIKSVLNELEIKDEIIISDDSSTDSTIQLINSISDNRIKVYSGKFHSPIYNFENALEHSSGDIIILCDQDDIWLKGRISEVKDYFAKTNASLIVNRCNIIDEKGALLRTSYFHDKNPVDHSLLKNLINNPYIGCCMAFRRNILDLALPFPKKIPMHDSWIGLLAQHNGKCIYIDKPLVNYRRHKNNATKEKSPYSLIHKIHSRIILLYNIHKRTLTRKCKKFY